MGPSEDMALMRARWTVAIRIGVSPASSGSSWSAKNEDQPNI